MSAAFSMLGGCLIAAAVLISGCRTGLDQMQSINEAATREVAPAASKIEAAGSQNRKIESAQAAGAENRRPVQASSRRMSYYYYAVAQRMLREGQPEEAVWMLAKAVESDPGSNFLKLELAEILAADQQDERALEYVETILAREPDNLPALVMSAKIHQQGLNIEKAKQVFEKAMAADPQDQSIYVSLGRLYWNEDDLVNAQRIFQRMVDNIPDSSVGHFFLGKVLVSQGELDSAAKEFDKSMMLDPSLEEPRLELVEIYKIQQRSDLVVKTFRDILDYHPDNIKVALDLALYEHHLGKTSEAVSLLAQLGRQSRSDDRIIALVYEKFLESKQYQTAVWVLESMLAGAPSSSDIHYLAGVACDGLEQHQAALNHLQQVDAGSRFYPSAVVHTALLHHNAGRMEQAIALIQQAIVQLPGNEDFHYYLAGFYEEQERYADAVAVLEKGLSSDSKNVRLSFRLGVVLDKMGRRQECIETMKTVVSLSPDHADALNYLGYTYAEMGIQLDEAEQLIRLALKNKPENGYITDSLGWVYYKRGEYQTALEWLQKALKLVPDDPAILEHVGDVYLKLNQTDQALSYFNRSLEVNPENRETLKEKIHSLLKSPASHLSE